MKAKNKTLDFIKHTLFKKESIVPTQLLVPFLLVSLLFALWGFANAVTDPMVNVFKKVLELSNFQASWVQMAFYGGYFCMALPASLLMRKYSYKTGIIIGLGLYALGALLFYPAAITEQFWFFCLGLYVLTFGLAFLETAANPYILAMGEKKTATQRLNLAQSLNPVGLIAGLLVAKYFVYDNILSDDILDFGSLDETRRAAIRVSDLAVVRDPYVALGLLISVFFVLFISIKMPQIKIDESKPKFKDILNKLLKNKKYAFGVISQILYVGAQIMTWTYIYQYTEAIELSRNNDLEYLKIDVFRFQLVAFILFTIGRFIGTPMLRYISPGKLLMGSAICAVISVTGTIFFQDILGLYFLVSISFWMSIMFPTIYGIALYDLTEDESKIGSAGLVMAIVGGALLPMLQGYIIDAGGDGVADTLIMGVSEVNFSFILPFSCFIIIALYGYYSHKMSNQF
ncbi:L-fucose:H+ symporter permease [Flavobacteriaceae bacterium]|nr:L-fucose:H+ symporter permease [Flavobacteriaceae bacterium]MDB4112998.1 L-fucose:H+ symporter permease [Flavobacteriaceae bacterium]MDB4186616.1 L-fucose:H+ symporter permease [Flavobacteriaceae bacterium]MDB9821593.1 L-fucose:H+ symporter permease [Flavobacteriaceae bacterium]MDC1434349.1 L-fucose:H+ symporter permease [Flavobacteriaceae bacterium]